MKPNDILKATLTGAVLTVAEYRSTTGETIRYRDKKSGAAMSMPVATHACEFGALQVKVSEMLPDGANPADVKAPFAKGSKVVVHIETLERVSGSLRARGRLELLEAGA